MQTIGEHQKSQNNKARCRQKRQNRKRKHNNSDAARLFRFILRELSKHLSHILIEHLPIYQHFSGTRPKVV